MRDITTIAVNTVATSAANPGLENAHRIAAMFHEAMADAIEAMAEIDADDDTPLIDKEFWRARHTDALGRAAAALQQMPVAWAAVLNVKMASGVRE